MTQSALGSMGEPPSVWNEARAAQELAELSLSPIYYGRGVPRGDGRLVIVLPGLFANDLYLHPLRTWLSRVGYRPVRSTLMVNAGCPERLTRQVEDELRRKMRRRVGPVAVIGHSRGGILARAIAARLGHDASQLILLGSPAGVLSRMYALREARERVRPAGRALADASNRARQMLDPDCNVPECGCPFPDDLGRPLSVNTRVTSIYSADDPIVPPAACHVEGGWNVEVRGTHSGLAYNVAAYRAMAEALAG